MFGTPSSEELLFTCWFEAVLRGHWVLWMVYLCKYHVYYSSIIGFSQMEVVFGHQVAAFSRLQIRYISVCKAITWFATDLLSLSSLRNIQFTGSKNELAIVLQGSYALRIFTIIIRDLSANRKRILYLDVFRKWRQAVSLTRRIISHK